MIFEKVCYKGWPNCGRISSEKVDMIFTLDIGPRLIRFGFRDDVNEFAEFDEDLGKTGGEHWRPYGGHRLMHAPEDPLRTYAPDSQSVELQEPRNCVRFIRPIEISTEIQKEIYIKLVPDGEQAQVTHRLVNHNLWPITLCNRRKSQPQKPSFLP